MRKEMNLALHGFHELFDTIATALLWSPAARTEMGRWVFQVDAHGARQQTKGENKVIFARYATEVSSMIQSKLRGHIIKAVRFVLLSNSDWHSLSMTPTWKNLFCPHFCLNVIIMGHWAINNMDIKNPHCNEIAYGN